MPGSLMMADANFPRFTGTESTEQKLSTIQNYLFQLTEQLRWAYANIGKENFNETEFEEISNIITKPVYITLEKETGDIRNELTITATDLTSKITSVDGRVSELRQDINGITFEVANGEDSSYFTMQVGSTAIQSPAIKMTGMVTFKRLGDEEDQTVINGATITTGTINAMDLYGSNFYCTMDNDDLTTGDIYFCYPNSRMVVGGLQINNSGDGTSEESKYRVFLYTRDKFALKLQSEKGISIESDGGVYLRGGSGINLTGTVRVTGALYVNGVKVATETTTA